MTFAFLRRALAMSEQLTEPAISRAVARIDQNVRRVVSETEPRTDQQFRFVSDLRIAKLIVGPHHAGQRVVVGNADDRKPKLAGLMHILLRMRAAAQKRKIRSDADLGIVRRCVNAGRVHANNPCTNQPGCTGLSSFTISPYNPSR